MTCEYVSGEHSVPALVNSSRNSNGYTSNDVLGYVHD